MPPVLIVARFIAGLGIGAELPLCDAYLGELLPARHRGRYTAMAYTLGFIGVPAVGFLARVLVPLAPLDIAGWRWVFALGSLGGVIIWRLRRRLPESPRWLESVGRHDEANRIVGAMEAEAWPGAGRRTDAAAIPADRTTARARVPLRVLFSPEYRGRTAMLGVFQVFQAVGYYGFGTLVPMVLVAKGFSVVTSLTYTSLVVPRLSPRIGAVDPGGRAGRSALADRRLGVADGRLRHRPRGGAVGRGDRAASGSRYTMAANIFSNAFHIFQAEIFPTAVRATAAGTAYGLSRLSSAAMPFILLPLLSRAGAVAAFSAVGVAMLIVVLDIALFAPRTTGRALEDVAAA